MDHELIANWLQLPPGKWPVDHYTLLGLSPGEPDLTRIEQHVHERMERVRRYQLIHPESATEAMNRLAQALVCLTDPRTKQAYDVQWSAAAQPSPQPEPQRSAPLEVAVREPAVKTATTALDPLTWLFGPHGTMGRGALPQPGPPPAMLQWQHAPPQLLSWEHAPPPLRLRLDPGAGAAASEEGSPPTDAPAPDSLTTAPQPEVPAASRVTVAPRDLTTKRGLFYHITQTRRLLWSWRQAGKYLNGNRRVSRPAEATELIRHMTAIRELVRTFPPLLGEAGQPGYLIVALARQQMIVPMLQTLLPSQREALARDWQAGHGQLLAHSRFLRQQLHMLRRRSRWQHALRASLRSLIDHPSLLLLLMALLALNLAFPGLRELWLRQVIFFSALLGLKTLLWWLSLRPLQHLGRLPPAVASPPSRPAVRLGRQPNSSRA
jgi:hypothetical protein